MDFIKQYLIQSISQAAGNLRLNSNQIETLALFKELIIKSDHLEGDLLKMKKITELSTLAIKLHEIYSFLIRNTIDISTISEKFKLHSQQLVKDVNLLLYNADHSNFRSLFDKIKQEEKEPIVKIIEENITSDEEKEEGSFPFTKFEETILNPIKAIDLFLNEISELALQSEKENLPDNIYEFIETMKRNSELSKENGFEILSGMHSLIYDSLNLMKEGDLKADKETIESIRACLIVIVAVVRGKEVNISDYLNKAENFSKKINSIKLKEEK
ncbi:MAG: hypothetical protein A2V93_01985 [Ignavibacteria bacterium RBG_16_34_14]|nr:MAG: hypothetical protein A2V93_01985 [Ignavibacteria bacterium RBG_16_34_14]